MNGNERRGQAGVASDPHEEVMNCLARLEATIGHTVLATGYITSQQVDDGGRSNHTLDFI
jgi:hypothetical protein